MTEKEKIKTWLERNRDERVRDNSYLTLEQQVEISDKLTALIDAIDTTPESELIEKGNSVLEGMNDMINATRAERLPTLDKFLEAMYSTKGEFEDACGFVMGVMNDMLDLKLYSKAIEYLTAVDIVKVKDPSTTLFCMMTGSNPISPLLRPIPKKENIQEFQVKRYAYFEKVKQYYIDTDQQNLADCVRIAKPENYDEDVKGYDMLYLFGAPKEQ